MCAPFWWSIQLGDEPAPILNNGTIGYVNTGTRELGVTADHVYNKYLEHIGQHGTDAVRCQLGGPSISCSKTRTRTRRIEGSSRLGVSSSNPKGTHGRNRSLQDAMKIGN